MHRKLLVSAGAVIALSTISIVAFVNSFSGTETRAQVSAPTVIITEHAKQFLYELVLQYHPKDTIVWTKTGGVKV